MKTQTITSRDNAQVKTIKRLAQKSSSYKFERQIWLEGEHLCDAYLLAHKSDARLTPAPLKTAVLSQSASSKWLPRLEARVAQGLYGLVCETIILPDALFDSLSSMPSSGGLGFVLSLPECTQLIHKTAHTVVLDCVQDAGNVGSILRSSAAFGVTQVLALEGTALLWSPKVLRAAMGAHFALHMVEGLNADDLQLDVPMLVTHVHEGEYLHQLQAEKKIPNPCAWVMGHEGQGVSQAILDKASKRININQAGQESLNVAAAAAVCLYASTVGH
jgi:TrmH family RNA methyltransferase